MGADAVAPMHHAPWEALNEPCPGIGGRAIAWPGGRAPGSAASERPRRVRKACTAKGSWAVTTLLVSGARVKSWESTSMASRLNPDGDVARLVPHVDEPKVKVFSIEIACRGPSGNIHVTLSVSAWGWQL